MTKVVVPLASGFEEIEAVTVIDVLRRAGVEVVVAGLGASPVRGSHDLGIATDCDLADVRAADVDAIVLPGGMPGAQYLKEDEGVQALIKALADAGKLTAAICAAPIALEAAGVLKGRRATSYPGFELPSADYCEQRVVEDGGVLTSRGPGSALEFALALVERLVGTERADELRRGMLVAD